MPVYNAADTVDAAIASVVDQTETDWELLLFDDGSTDSTLDRLREWGARDARVRLVGTERLGIVAALQRLTEDAQGRYFARMDADDVAYRERFSYQLAEMESNPDISLCGAQVRMVGENIGSGRLRYAEWLNSLTSHEAIVRDIFIECPIAHPTFFVRREAFERVGGYEENGWAEDYDLVMRLYCAGARFANVPEVLLDWRERADRHSMTDARYSPAQFRALKRTYLQQTHLKSGRPFHQWGAGEVGKAWLRDWGSHWPDAAVDLHPRKIGTRIHDVPIIAPDALPGPGQTFIVVAVGAPGAREDIRAWFIPRGYVETRDYCFLA
jgi:glycosyltransferase involved in cell wall biosynthesis